MSARDPGHEALHGMLKGAGLLAAGVIFFVMARCTEHMASTQPHAAAALAPLRQSWFACPTPAEYRRVRALVLREAIAATAAGQTVSGTEKAHAAKVGAGCVHFEAGTRVRVYTRSDDLIQIGAPNASARYWTGAGLLAATHQRVRP